MAAPPYLENVDDILNDVIAGQATGVETVGPNAATTAGVNNMLSSSIRASHSSNNVLNPNLSGSFKDDDNDDDAPLQCIYEPIATVTPTATSASLLASCQRTTTDVAQEANTNNATDSVFIQTPTQGGIAVAALPPNNNDNNTNNNKFWYA